MWLIGGGYLSNDDDNDAHMEKGISFLKITAQYFFLLCCREKVSSQKEFLIYSFGFTRIFELKEESITFFFEKLSQ